MSIGRKFRIASQLQDAPAEYNGLSILVDPPGLRASCPLSPWERVRARGFSSNRLQASSYETGRLEHCDRVYRRRRAPRQTQRRYHEKELPGAEPRACVGQAAQVAVVEQVQPHRRDRYHVNRNAHPGSTPSTRRDVADAVTTQESDSSLVEPGKA